jgi:uncharacterized pyridoxamine 5'-phosphate oxidase family protein
VFAPNDNPNDGDQPLYVVVEFNSYCGLAWDEENPKVRTFDRSLNSVDMQYFLTSQVHPIHRASQYPALLINATVSVATAHPAH